MSATIVVGTNSYGTLAEAEAYMLTRLYVSEWDSASDDTKNRALIMSVREMQSFRWIGSKTEKTQNLDWPRTETYIDGVTSTVVPEDIKSIQFEIAFALILNDTTRASNDNRRLIKTKISKLEFEHADIPTTKDNFAYAKKIAQKYTMPLFEVVKG